MYYLIVIYIVAAIALLGLLFCGLGLRNVKKRRIGRALPQSMFGVLILVIALLGAGLTLNLHTYQRLTYEAPVAEVFVRALPNKQYEVYVKSTAAADAKPTQAEVYTLRGDEWQLDARVLKWHPRANVLGLNTQYRLERLSSRYRDIQQARTTLPDVFAMHDPDAASGVLSLAQIQKRYPKWLDFFDTVYGGSVYMPLANQAEYSVHITQSGLVARPINQAALQAVKRW